MDRREAIQEVYDRVCGYITHCNELINPEIQYNVGVVDGLIMAKEMLDERLVGDDVVARNIDVTIVEKMVRLIEEYANETKRDPDLGEIKFND